MKTPLKVAFPCLFAIFSICQSAYAFKTNSVLVATIFGQVLSDVNNDGMNDPGDTGLPSINVNITQSDGTMLTVTTDPDGNWTASVIAGMTTVDVDDPAGLQHTYGTDPETMMVDDDANVDFGLDGFAGIPDLSVTLNIHTSLYGNTIGTPSTTNTKIFFDVYEGANVNTNGLITIIMPKDSRMTFTYDNTLTGLGLYALDNADWIYDNSNFGFHIWTSSVAIMGIGKSSFGLDAVYDPQGGDGEVSFTAIVITGSGGEMNNANNQDTDTITYVTY